MSDSQSDSQRWIEQPTRPDESDMIAPCDCRRCAELESSQEVLHSHHCRLDAIEQRLEMLERADSGAPAPLTVKPD